MSGLVRGLVEAFLAGDLVPAEDCESGGITDPTLARLFSDDRTFNILEWITDEPGKGETSITIGAKVRGATLQMMEEVLRDPRCPYNSRSDLLRDAILTTLYIIFKGRFGDDEAAEWAARERARAKAIQVQESRNAIVMHLREMRTYVDEATAATRLERALDTFDRLAKLIDKDVTAAVSLEAEELARHFWGQLDDEGREKMRNRYPGVVKEIT